MLEILYYPDGQHGPVREHLTRLELERPKAFARLTLDLEVLAVEGMRSRRIAIRPLGHKLWELKRLHDGIQYRIFLGTARGAAWLVHSIEKKSARTPGRDLELARKRLKEVLDQ